MTPWLVAAGAVVVAGGIAGVTARRASVVAIGIAFLLGAAPFLADPLPSPIVLVEGIVGGILAAELLWLSLRGRPLAGATALRWPAMALLGAAAFVAGTGAQQLVAAASGATLGAALALAVVAVVAVAARSDGVHLGLAAIVLLVAASVVRVALSGSVSALETLLVAGAGVAFAGAVGLLAPRSELVVAPADAGITVPVRADTIPTADPALPSAVAAARVRARVLSDRPTADGRGLAESRLVRAALDEPRDARRPAVGPELASGEDPAAASKARSAGVDAAASGDGAAAREAAPAGDRATGDVARAAGAVGAPADPRTAGHDAAPQPPDGPGS